MNTISIKGYVAVILSGLVILAAAVLVLFQWGNFCDISLYGKNTKYNTGMTMLLSAVGGLLIYHLTRMLIWGIKAISKGKCAAECKAAQIGSKEDSPT